jgi:aldose sugar dehydrogenase
MLQIARLVLGLAVLGVSGPALAQNREFPPSPRIEGKSNETRPPEKADDKPAFAGQTRAPFHASVAIKTTVITDKLTRPWGLAFLPGGKFLVTEKAGALRIVAANGAVSAPITGVPAVATAAQGGLLDVQLDPNYAANKRIFFTFTEPRAGGMSAIAIGRAALDEAAGALKDFTVIYRVKEEVADQQANQQGSRIAIARDGTLFVTIGDRSRSPPWLKAQDMSTALGKVIHITADGAPTPGNPFVNTPGALPEIWALGIRTPQGIAFDANGQLWETEHAARGGDELNKIERGKNYGWPIIVHGIDYPGDKVGEGISQKEGLEQARYYWDPVIAPASLAFYNGALFPKWKGSVLIGALRGQMVTRLTLSGDKVIAEEPLLIEPRTRIRDVREGPDGAVYLLTEADSLLKITPR